MVSWRLNNFNNQENFGLGSKNIHSEQNCVAVDDQDSLGDMDFDHGNILCNYLYFH